MLVKANWIKYIYYRLKRDTRKNQKKKKNKKIPWKSIRNTREGHVTKHLPIEMNWRSSWMVLWVHPSMRHMKPSSICPLLLSTSMYWIFENIYCCLPLEKLAPNGNDSRMTISKMYFGQKGNYIVNVFAINIKIFKMA